MTTKGDPRKSSKTLKQSHNAELPSSSLLLSRRGFVAGACLGGALVASGVPKIALSYSEGQTKPHHSVLSGNILDLHVGYKTVNFSGRQRLATAINDSLPAPTIRFREGEQVTIRVHNRLAEHTSIHWHGIILPTNMDGVPGLSFSGIAPGEYYEYAFNLVQHGTYWYHSHSGFQEQTGLYGALIIEPRTKEPFFYNREHVLMLSDWTDEKPERIYAKLKGNSEYYRTKPRTLIDLWQDVSTKGIAATWNERLMWNRMRMSDRDISDVTGYTYTFLMNGIEPKEGWVGLFKPDEIVRLRVINASAMTFFDFRIPGLQMSVVAADGQEIEPVTVDEFRIGVAETYDILVRPECDTAYTLFAQAIDRSGYARGTLTPDPELTAAIPELDPYPILSHMDMGMSMEKHGDHMKHMSHLSAQNKTKTQMGKPGLTQGKTGGLPFRNGPQIDMLADAPEYRLNDPGVGLRCNGRRVLTYADLINLYPTPDPREPDREIELHLTGNMMRYMWSFNGIKFADAEPLYFCHGERLRITLINDTMMNHPIHLHGMWSDLETGDNTRLPRKHTIIVQPGSKISYRVTVNAKGRWAYHCHLLYHMLGMFREVIVT